MHGEMSEGRHIEPVQHLVRKKQSLTHADVVGSWEVWNGDDASLTGRVICFWQFALEVGSAARSGCSPACGALRNLPSGRDGRGCPI